MQVALARLTCGHGLSQPPQCAVALSVSTQAAPHLIVGATQSETQCCGSVPAPTAHSGAALVQASVQPPQCSGSVTSVSQPSSALLLQCARPLAHALSGTTHWPALQLTAPETFASAVQS